MHPKFDYRPEINGLRAIAIIAVLLFHYFPKTFPNGYLGVDLFFVISGFLISSIIYVELSQKKFSLVNFWARRAVRLLPALLCVLVLVWATGWLIFTPREYATLGKHLLGGTFFYQNFILWTEVGYFDALAIQKPLLHLWSLSLEEQFYIIWPLLILLGIKSKISPLAVSGFITICSLLTAFSYNQSSSPACFYLPFGRIWELSVGALLASIMHTHRYGNHNRDNIIRTQKKLRLIAAMLYQKALEHQKALFSFSLLIIFYSLFFGFRHTSHEVKALILVTATVTIIFAAEKKVQFQGVLTFPFLTYIGKISYPLYLYHWPLFSFGIIVFGEVGVAGRLGLVFISILMAALTHRFIELPIQQNYRKTKRIHNALQLLVLLCAVGAVGAYTKLSGGVGSRFGFDTAKIEAAKSDWRALKGGHEVQLSGIDVIANTRDAPEILFLGDSFAVQYFPKVMELTKDERSKNIAFLTEQGCLPIKGFRSNTAPCGRFYENTLSVLKNTPTIKTVIVALAWQRLCKNKDEGYGIEVGAKILNVASGEFGKGCFDLYVDLIKTLSENHAIYVISSQPVGPEFEPDNVFFTIDGQRHFPIWSGKDNFVDSFPLNKESTLFDRKFASALSKTPAKIIWTSEVICPKGICHPFSAEGDPKYFDQGHFRASYVIAEFESLAKILRKDP